jgi:hypothetical protein
MDLEIVDFPDPGSPHKRSTDACIRLALCVGMSESISDASFGVHGWIMVD